MLTNKLMGAAAGAEQTDPNFKNVSLLLTGDGTNGAQNNTFLDSSTNNFTITRNGNTTQGTFSPYGNLWSNYFDGTGDYLAAASNAVFQMGTGAYTIEAWVYMQARATSPYESCIICLGNASGGQGVYVTANGAVDMTIYGSSVVIASSANDVPLNAWTHIAVVRSSTATNDTRIYVNGTLKATATDANNWTVAATLSVGGLTSLSTFYTNGYISNLRVVKGTALYTSNFTPSTTPLTAVSGTSLLTCQSNRFIDNSSNNFAITVNGNTSVQRFSPFNPTVPYSASTIGGSGYFDGSGDYLSLTDTSNVLDLGNATASFECWAYATAFPSQSVIIMKGNSNSYNTTNGIEYGLTFASGVIAFYYNSSGSAATLTDSTVRKLNQWYHIVVATNSTTISLFVNGSRVATVTAGITKPTTRTSVLLGNSQAGEVYNGYLSNTRYVSGSEAYSAAASTITVPTSPVTAISGTSLLCNFTNAGIPDLSMQNDLETVGNAQVSTSVKKYGTGSLYFDGSGDYLKGQASDLYAFGTGDFTIEMWVNEIGPGTGGGGWKPLFTNRGTDASSIFFGIQDAQKLIYYRGSTLILDSVPLTYNVWYHVALVRSGTTITLYKNGTSVGSVTDTTNITGNTCYIAQESNLASTYFNGYIDDLRITKGLARYTANFTPPAQALPTQ